MVWIANEVDKAPVSRLDGWHAALLRRLANPYPGVRGAIISTRCLALLDRLRAFRHRERNSYGIDLDFEIVVQRGHEAIATFAEFQTEVMLSLGQEFPD